MTRLIMSFKSKVFLFIFFGTLFSGVPGIVADEIKLVHEDIFGKLRRPAVRFDHDIHSERLSDGGCGLCHHAPDETTGKLVYIEDEELGCAECHGAVKKNRIPALREAFHGSCTVCHRRLKQSDPVHSGPTTCGGCHRKE